MYAKKAGYAGSYPSIYSMTELGDVNWKDQALITHPAISPHRPTQSRRQPSCTYLLAWHLVLATVLPVSHNNIYSKKSIRYKIDKINMSAGEIVTCLIGAINKQMLIFHLINLSTCWLLIYNQHLCVMRMRGGNCRTLPKLKKPITRRH